MSAFGDHKSRTFQTSKIAYQAAPERLREPRLNPHREQRCHTQHSRSLRLQKAALQLFLPSKHIFPVLLEDRCRHNVFYQFETPQIETGYGVPD